MNISQDVKGLNSIIGYNKTAYERPKVKFITHE